MSKKLTLLAILFTVFCALSTVSYAMGSAPPPPTQEVEIVPSASEEALAKEQIENLRNNAMNSETIQEAFNKCAGDIFGGKKYLYEFNDIAKKELLRIVADKKENWKFRIAAMFSMSATHQPGVFDLERKIYEDKSERMEIRSAAFNGISPPVRPEKKEELVDISIKALKEDDWDIVATAANNLEMLKDPKAVGPLMDSVRRTRSNLDKLLQSGWKGYEKHSTPEDQALSCSIRALGEIGDERAVPVLIEVLQDPYVANIWELEDMTRGWAVIALRKINDKRAIEPIKELLKVTKDYRIIEVAKDALKVLEENDGASD